MLSKAEEKAIEEKAHGKPILFTPRHWTLYEWVKEQPGKSLRDKLHGVVKRAYQLDYERRGRLALTRYWSILEKEGLTPMGLSQMAAVLSDACECFGRAGLNDEEEHAREMLRAVVYQQYKRKSDIAA